MKDDLQKSVLPKWLASGETKQRFEREASFALQAINSNGLLQKCTKESLMASVYSVALTGLSLNPVLKHAVLVPRWNSKDERYEACLEPEYQGLIHLALGTGRYKAFIPGIIYEGDEIDMDYSNSRKILKHIPFLQTGKEKGNIKAVYSIAILTDGTELGEVMTWPEIEAIRDRSESWKAYKADKIKSCIWLTDSGEMSKKTVIKRQLKYLSRGENERLSKAIDLDNQVHGFRPFADVNQIEFLTHLIEEELKVDDQALQSLRLKLKAVQFRDEAIALQDHIFEEYCQRDVNLGQHQIGKLVDEAVSNPDK